jgi:DNA-binding PadR family transcriptional regulator
MIRTFFGPGHRGHGHHDHGEHGSRRFRRGFDRLDLEFSRGFGPGWGRGRARRGDVKFLVLDVLAEGPRHGYDIINAIEERRGFRPSAGSIYPTLQMLEDGEFVTAAEVDGKRVYTITETGRALLATRGTEPDGDEFDELEPRHRLKLAAVKLAGAVMNVRRSDDATLEKARTILDRARKEIYALLAAEDA